MIERRIQALDRVVTTWVTAAELYYGAAKSSDPHGNTLGVSEFMDTLEVLRMDDTAARRFGGLKAKLERDGHALADADLFIGSVCLAWDAVLVTGNIRHYRRIDGLSIEDWIRGS